MARRRTSALPPLPVWVTFVPAEGRPVVPQHEEWHRDFLEWLWTGGQRMGLGWIMGQFRQARATAVAATEDRRELFTTSSWEWTGHLLGEDADPREVERLGWELWNEWSPGSRPDR